MAILGNSRRWFLVLLMMVVTGLQSYAYAADQLIVYSGRSDKFVRPVVEKFTEKTGIKVVLHAAESTALLNKLRIEQQRTRADLYISNDAGNLQVGSNNDLFKPLDPDLVNVIPAQFRAPDNTWIGLSARARVLVVNKDASAATELTSVFDLAGKKWKGRIGITNSSNESFIAGVTVYMLATDKKRVGDWLTGLKANVKGQVFTKHSHIVKAVAGGKLEAGLVNHYYIYRHLAEHPDASIDIVLPDQGANDMGVAWNVAGVAMTKYSRQPELAQKLISYFVSEEGQKMFAEVNREYPTREGVPAAKEVPAPGSYKVADVPMDQLAEHRNATIDLLESVGMP